MYQSMSNILVHCTLHNTPKIVIQTIAYFYLIRSVNLLFLATGLVRCTSTVGTTVRSIRAVGRENTLVERLCAAWDVDRRGCGEEVGWLEGQHVSLTRHLAISSAAVCQARKCSQASRLTTGKSSTRGCSAGQKNS